MYIVCIGLYCLYSVSVKCLDVDSPADGHVKHVWLIASSLSIALFRVFLSFYLSTFLSFLLPPLYLPLLSVCHSVFLTSFKSILLILSYICFSIFLYLTFFLSSFKFIFSLSDLFCLFSFCLF